MDRMGSLNNKEQMAEMTEKSIKSRKANGNKAGKKQAVTKVMTNAFFDCPARAAYQNKHLKQSAVDATKYCIYLTTNKLNGKRYVGQHKYKKLHDGYLGSGKLIKQALKKYGKENFEIEYLETDLTDPAEVDWFEKWYINVLNPEYNLAVGGQGVRYRDTISAQEHKLHLSESHKGKKRTKEAIEKTKESIRKYYENMNKAEREALRLIRREIWIARTQSPEARAKRRASKKGKKLNLSVESRRKLAERLIWYNKNVRVYKSQKGRPCTWRDKISEAMKGKKFSEEHKRNLRKPKLWWYTNGVERIRCYSKDKPEGFVLER